MRETIICFIFFVASLGANAQELNLADIRRDFNKGIKDESLCKKYLQQLEAHASKPEEKGYEAAFKMFMAKFTGNPIKKMSHFKSGKNLLEKQIKSNPNNVELRFIRLCIQYHIPSYLGYKNNIEDDKAFLVANLHKLSDNSTKEILYKHLKGANMYSNEELALLKR